MNTGVTQLDSSNMEEMIKRLGAYRILMLMQTILAEKANSIAGRSGWECLTAAANHIHHCANGVDRIFHGETP